MPSSPCAEDGHCDGCGRHRAAETQFVVDIGGQPIPTDSIVSLRVDASGKLMHGGRGLGAGGFADCSPRRESQRSGREAGRRPGAAIGGCGGSRLCGCHALLHLKNLFRNRPSRHAHEVSLRSLFVMHGEGVGQPLSGEASCCRGLPSCSRVRRAGCSEDRLAPFLRDAVASLAGMLIGDGGGWGARSFEGGRRTMLRPRERALDSWFSALRCVLLACPSVSVTMSGCARIGR